ncbi:MAG: hydrolase [Deltaproteobacteria bacterium]|nr:hydrolase [Deltaproteobacteria bacterium]
MRGGDKMTTHAGIAAATMQVVAGVLFEHGRVLICQRRADDHHPDQWEFPGGKVEPGEDLEQALRRELVEELGIDARIGAMLWQTQHQYPGRQPVCLRFFHVTAYSGNPTNKVFAAIQWAAVGTLAHFDFLEGDREFVAQLDAGRVRPPGVGSPAA